MRIVPLKNKINSHYHNQNHSKFTDYLLDDQYGFYVEDYFNELLGIERKRTERSRKPFLLMLINIENIQKTNKKNEIIKKIASVISSSTREIDLKGWYKHSSVIGVIFTEISNIETYGKNSIFHKIVNNLFNVIDLSQARKIGISVHFFPDEHDRQKKNDSPDLKLYPDLSKRDSSKKNSYFIKRTLDILISTLSLIIFAPFFPVISLLVKLSSKGPILFRQERVGLYGEKFIFLKFRTMYTNNNPDAHREFVKKMISEKNRNDTRNNGGQEDIYKIQNDSRITPLGWFLRKTSLDELPQLVNVIKGEMSLVGPRPPIPYETEEYDIWQKRRFLETKPGITGLWQVQGRSRIPFEDMVRLDLKYIKEWSLWSDVKILLKTPWAVLTCKGAF